MTKNMKIAAVVSAAALLAIGASMTSFAATGWVEEDGTWRYYKANGELSTGGWQKSGSNWFYLDDDGNMATDSLIEDDDNYYYVDANGAMVTNQWIQMDNEDYGDDDDQPSTWWYYFQNNGKAYKRGDTTTSDVSLKTINGKKYTFNDDGKMQYGWVSDGETQYDDDAFQTCNYYFGDENDGAMSQGWREIHLTSVDNADTEQPGDDFWDEDQDRWFWFKASGKKQTDKDGKEINGKKYGFDEYGRMIADWYTTATLEDAIYGDNSTASSASTSDYINSFRYYSSPEDGARKTKGWFKVVPGYYMNESDHNDSEDKWYYADGSGKIYAGEIKTIKGKKYGFKPNGEMLDGLVLLDMTDDSSNITTKTISAKYDDDGSLPYDTEDNFDDTIEAKNGEDVFNKVKTGEWAFYYFSSDADHDGSMKTGKQTLSLGGDSCKFDFYDSGARKGQGITGVDDKKYYRGGKLVAADKDDKFDIIDKSGASYYEKLGFKDFIDTYMDESTNSDGDSIYTWKSGTTSAEKANFVVINTTGSVQKSGTKKDGDDYKVYISGSVITKIVLDN